MQHLLIEASGLSDKGACGPVDRELDSRSEVLEFDSQCYPCVEVSGKLHISHCLIPPRRNGYPMHRSKVGSIVAGCIGTYLARGKVKSVEHALPWSVDSKQLPLPVLQPCYQNSVLYSLISSGEKTVHFLQPMPFTILRFCSTSCRYPSLLGGRRRHIYNMRGLPNTSTHGRWRDFNNPSKCSLHGLGIVLIMKDGIVLETLLCKSV